jgi:hypothetical protein
MLAGTHDILHITAMLDPLRYLITDTLHETKQGR